MLRQLTSLIAAVTILVMPATAVADQASGWAAWEAKAAAILAAVREPGHSEAKRQHVKEVCKGISGIVIGSGFQFPRWAQLLMPMCGEIDDIVGSDKEVTRRSWSIQCRSIKTYIGPLGKAEPVAIAPTAHEKALALSAFLATYYEDQCAHGLKRA